jgi:hypothetical protein
MSTELKREAYGIMHAAFMRLRETDPSMSADDMLATITRPEAMPMRVWSDVQYQYRRYAKQLPPLYRAEVSPARNQDLDTAQIAALINTSLRKGQRVDVLIALAAAGYYGATDFELSEACSTPESKMLRTSAGKRRKELCDVGCAMITDDRRPTDTDSPAVVWRITATGRKVVAAIQSQTL